MAVKIGSARPRFVAWERRWRDIRGAWGYFLDVVGRVQSKDMADLWRVMGVGETEDCGGQGAAADSDGGSENRGGGL
ncbi:hypothetical protein CCP2SC5_130013 [Azospirillaceae bacterium]